jgi:hypothetical protein
MNCIHRQARAGQSLATNTTVIPRALYQNNMSGNLHVRKMENELNRKNKVTKQTKSRKKRFQTQKIKKIKK